MFKISVFLFCREPANLSYQTTFRIDRELVEMILLLLLKTPKEKEVSRIVTDFPIVMTNANAASHISSRAEVMLITEI
jgi:hypothetical protein